MQALSFLSYENDPNLLETFIMNGYFALKRLSFADESAYGLNNQNVDTEQIPLVVNSADYVQYERSRYNVSSALLYWQALASSALETTHSVLLNLPYKVVRPMPRKRSASGRWCGVERTEYLDF